MAKLSGIFIIFCFTVFGGGYCQEDWRCEWEPSEKQIYECLYEEGDQISHGESSCWRVNRYIDCAKATSNENCLKNAFHLGANIVPYGPEKGDIYDFVTSLDQDSETNECYKKAFDEYFNQNGKCTFKNVKDIMICYLSKVGNDWHEWTLMRDIGQSCNNLDILDTCMNEINTGCLELGQNYLRQLKAHYNLNDPTSCLENILNRNIETDESHESNNSIEFPIFKQLLKELVEIEKRLKEQ